MTLPSPFQHKKIKEAREGLLTEVEKFIDEERYGTLSTDEFVNLILDSICRHFPVNS
tara:strand:- start:317 stop:487 length:171 start_codon:yes stop_codon:yes gene_type:complete